jgi:hypothetical protein
VAIGPPVFNIGSAPSSKGSEASPPTVPGKRERWLVRSPQVKLAAQRQALMVAANRKALQAAKAIESWESPTSSLLSSPSDEVLKSVPQLNQSAEELKSFLPSRPK